MVDKHIVAVFWRTAAGEEPVRAFLRSLSVADRYVIGRDIARCEYGWPLGMPVARALGEGLWEVRSSLPSRREARVFFSVDRNDMVLLHAIVKKTRETPPRDLSIARRRRSAYERGNR
jgi:phage-related protein